MVVVGIVDHRSYTSLLYIDNHEMIKRGNMYIFVEKSLNEFLTEIWRITETESS